MKKSIALEKSFNFSLAIIRLYQELQNNREFVLSKQLLRSSTSIGANVSEALSAFSAKDFTYKMSIACKEARETTYWLKLLQHAQLVENDYSPYLIDSEELLKMLTAIVKTSKAKANL